MTRIISGVVQFVDEGAGLIFVRPDGGGKDVFVETAIFAGLGLEPPAAGDRIKITAHGGAGRGTDIEITYRE